MSSGLGLIVLVRAIEICIGVEENPGMVQFNFEDSIVYDLKSLGDPGRFTTKRTGVHLLY